MDQISFGKLFQVLPELETKSYFDLEQKTKDIISSLEAKNGDAGIDAWSFIPHPEIFSKLQTISRYIVTIDTISSQVYFSVFEFLRGQKANVSSYYSGGWADFVCEVHFDEKNFDRWYKELKQVLVDANAEKFCPKKQGGLDSLLSVFKVIDSHILCRQPIADLTKPKPAILKEIQANPAQFEVVFRNYRSKDATALFGSEDAIQKYLNRLKEHGAILCFRVMTDISRYQNRDYVALRVRSRAVEGFLEHAQVDSAVLAPVEDFVEVDPIHWSEESVKEINHLFLNAYNFPGQRIDWKQAVYRWANPAGKNQGSLDLNVYNYPLEGTVNEQPIYLTDFPEFLERLGSYHWDASSGFPIGRGSHSSIPAKEAGPVASLPISGLAYHGMTLGGQGTGKTNTDLVLAANVLPHLRNVVVLDGTQSVWAKLDAAPDLKRQAVRIEVASERSLRAFFEQAAASTGLVVLEFSPEKYGLAQIMQAAIDVIESQNDLVRANQPRRVQHLLMIEEVADAWVERKSSSIGKRLVRLLEKSWRKGWAIWLSNQRIESLGPDERTSVTLLNILKNRVVHGVTGGKEEKLLLKVLEDEGHPDDEIEYVRRNIKNKSLGFALLRGAKQEGKDVVLLPAVFVTVPPLQQLHKLLQDFRKSS
jgi:hypothetical protein